MPGLDVLFIHDVYGYVLAGVVLSVRNAQIQGAHPQYIAGVLAQSEHMCLCAHASWHDLLTEARGLLDNDAVTLLDTALQLGAGDMRWKSSSH